jgi:hypothetical protein
MNRKVNAAGEIPLQRANFRLISEFLTETMETTSQLKFKCSRKLTVNPSEIRLEVKTFPNKQDFFFFFAVPGLELRAYTLSHYTSPIL